LAKSELAADVGPLVHHPPTARLRESVDADVANLLAAGLIAKTGPRLAATETGAARAASFLGLKSAVRLPWSEARDVRMVAKALGLQREPARRLKALATPDGLRAAILQRAYNLKIRGTATPSRLRAAMAQVALERAFGNRVGAGLTGKSGLSAKAGRLLAAQLSRRPRDFGTDRRLIAALAAEHVGTTHADLAGLRLAVLRRFMEASPKRVRAPKRHVPDSVPERVAPRPVEVALPSSPSPPPQIGRPDLTGFATEVHRHAAARALGWVGDRKAYISQVWRCLREQRPEWDISEIEFKCMLAEAHRAGALALANADLKDNDNIKELQDSAVVYKNAVFHFIRVEG
jgi:hypothetical protein